MTRTNFKAFLSTLLCIFILAFGFQPKDVAAQNQNVTHTVKAGETLYSVARQYNVDIKQLRVWNSLSGNEISVGQTLIVGKGGESAQQGQGDVIVHEVKAQETLFSISKQYGVTIAEIKTWNNLENNALDIGQKLTIHPPDQQNSGSGSDSSQSLVVDTPVSSNTYYTVKSGDTLYQIAREHNMSLDELKALNDLTSNTIRVGQRLTVKKTQSAPSVAEKITESSPQGKFVNYTVPNQQSLQEILKKFNMDEAEFEALNPNLNTASFQRGQKITVLAPPSKSYKNPYTVQANMNDLGETVISSYDSNDAGTTTTSGELYNPNELTAAHSNIALGNVVFVQNPRNNSGIYVRINDRFSGNGLKLSQAAFESLGLSQAANATVNIYQDQ